MLGAMQLFGIPADPSIVAFALLITGIVFAVAVISNDNLQDLKTGQLVAATPWRQQAALIVGVVAGSLVIPFLLNMLNSSFGFEGGPPPNVQGTEPLGAPQATLISSLAAGVIGGDPRWDLLGIGAILGVVIIAIDEILVRSTNKKMKLPPLAVGIGIYLPMAVTTTVTIGAIIGTMYDRWVSKGPNPEPAKRLGILMASGLIVGESLFNVALAGIITYTENGMPLALIPADSSWAGLYPMLAGIVVFFAITWALYAWTKKKADTI
jgi:putative OPT family oligopeptide transporter